MPSASPKQASCKENYSPKHHNIMRKLFILTALAVAACSNPADIDKSAPASAATTASLSMPAGFTIVELSPDGYFIRLSSAERASAATIRELAAAFAGSFDRIDLCLDATRERGDEYVAILDGMVYDYENNLIYSLTDAR